MHFKYLSQVLLRASIICMALVLTGVAVQGIGSATSNSQTIAWASPSKQAIKRISNTDPSQHEPTYLTNTDCTLSSYRVPTDTTMHTGCFTQTAFGMMDADTNMVIFTGTDEAVPLTGYTNNSILVPWPEALPLIALSGLSTGGDYLSIYKNPLEAMNDQRNILGQLTGKHLSYAPEQLLRDSNGTPIVINPQTIAFSEGGSWLVAETYTGSFIRINLATLETMHFAPAFGATGQPGVFGSEVAVSRSGRFVAINNQASGTTKVYDLQGCTSSPCPSHDYRQFITSQTGTLRFMRHLRFVDTDMLSFEATAEQPSRDGVYLLAPTGSIDFLTEYLGLGDSFTSGEGAFDYLSGTDEAGNKCHLSQRSYPLLLRNDLFSASSGHSVACSGAVINDIASVVDSYRGQVAGAPDRNSLETKQTELLHSIVTNYIPGYLPQQQFVRTSLPKVITVGIGGNDIGFGAMIQRCASLHISRHISDSTCYNTYEDRIEVTNLIDRTIPRWTALYRQLLAASPGTRLYAIGYPQVVNDRGSCGLNVHLDKSELEFSAETTAYLNAAIAKAASSAHVPYVDISQALFGHRLCEANAAAIAVNGLTAGKDGGIFGITFIGTESYHPNMLGQQLIEQAILEKTHNLTYATTSENSQTTSISTKPKSGRRIHNITPETITHSRIPKGTAVPVSSNHRIGTRPHAVYSVRLDGSTGTELTTTQSDELGSVATTVTIPQDTAEGGHTIDIIGPGQTDMPIDITQPIYVPNNNGDSDGDGVSDSKDSCLDVENSNVDMDHDGTDDACDGFIGSTTPPTTSVSVVETSENNYQNQPSITSSNGNPQLSNQSLQPVASTILSSTPKEATKTDEQHIKNNATKQRRATPPSSQKIHLTASKDMHASAHPHFNDLQTVNWVLWSLLIGAVLVLTRASWWLYVALHSRFQ